jgi:hypothetical protein
MQIMFTSSSRAHTRVLHLGRRHALLAAALLALLLGLLLHSIRATPYLSAWSPDDRPQRDRFLRQNLDAMAVRLGEMQWASACRIWPA